ncbi:Uncaracterized surface protein containing fasciclin (FAS1) repeats [Asanoa hainanensis]|uniref:Uncaracterized surface protein containing fasciclin (FAS1) repeats n=1 Tax=Asanoa hainanensis TaxID=560556 RepID=A0A239N5E8_9ACTN|nr:fasciclin domain-containing protein [Asanoa hainanensis]SNT49398.1 Uncaracterized surface protein containing fasciclin (FAS1) repeats [Asanoa hainanensis]
MRLLRTVAVAAAAIVTSALVAAPADAHGKVGTRSLAAVLTADTSGFDRNGGDYDILTAAVLAVLEAKPASAVGVLTDGSTALTAFIPNDRAFQTLVADLQHAKRLPSERASFTAVAGLGIDTVEAVLLYHVVPGATITRKAALKADGAVLTTAAGSTIKVDVYGWWWKRVRLVDTNRTDRDPRVVRFDVNKGNRQIAHGIDRVLRPIDLP